MSSVVLSMEVVFPAVVFPAVVFPAKERNQCCRRAIL
jgi:hypothetical protein